MKNSMKMKSIFIRIVLVVTILPAFFINANAQTMPEVMENGSFEEQTEYMKDRMNIYNGYRAVRDDIFLKMLKNSTDSLNAAKSEINSLEIVLKEKNSDISRLNDTLDSTREELDQAIKNRDSLMFLGISMTKVLYNVILWGIILGLLSLLVIMVLLYRRTRVVTTQTRKDLEDTKEEFETFRKSAREKSEQMVINHFNEIKKLKEGRV